MDNEAIAKEQTEEYALMIDIVVPGFGESIRNYLASAFLKGAAWGMRSAREGLTDAFGCCTPLCER